MSAAIAGVWDIVSSEDFDDAYLHLEQAPYVALRQSGDRVAGEYHIGLQSGSLDGRPRPDGSVLFSFEGTDEMDEVSGAATATVEGDRLVFTLMYHQGDDFTFEGRRRG
jgi:hypothetical protein